MSATTTVAVTRSNYREATRVLTSVLAPIEQRVLLWLARRLPPWIHSDHLTLLALVARLAGGLSYWVARATPVALLLVNACLAVNWFGDSLDGTLARVRGQERPRYGFYVDHVVDEFGAAFLLGGLALSGYMSPGVAALVLVSYFMLCIEVFLATSVLATFRMSFFKMGPTELRIVLAGGNLVAAVHPTVTIAGGSWLLFDVGGTIAAAGLVATLVGSAISNARLLARAEPRS